MTFLKKLDNFVVFSEICDILYSTTGCKKIGGKGMSINKKVYSFVLTGAALLSLSSISVFGASNHGDTKYNFNFPTGTSIQYTEAREKYNETAAYMKLKTLGGPATNPSYTASVVKKDNSNFSKVWYVTFGKSNINQGRYLKNYAKEDNKNKTYVDVKIKAKRDAGNLNDFYGSGVWSPDSI